MNLSVYILSSVTALVCSIMLLRGYQRRRARLLLWCGLFFCALTLENGMLCIDLFCNLDLAWPRRSVALFGLAMLLLGLILDSR